MKAIIQQCRSAYKAGDKEKYAALKKKLPLFIFMASSFRPTPGPSLNGGERYDTWRRQEAVHLNGLVMLDLDHVEDHPLYLPGGGVIEHPTPQDYFKVWKESHPEWFNFLPSIQGGDGGGSAFIYLVHITPSGHGLRLVCKADTKVGNLADNQQRIAEIISVTPDEACKDASRGSFAVTAEDILYLNPEIFDYDNKDYEQKFGADYRKGNSAGSVGNVARSKAKSKTATENETEAEQHPLDDQLALQAELEKHLQYDEHHEPHYNGVPFAKICEEYWKQEGGKPAVGTRHTAVLSLANRLRYITDNNPQALRAVIDGCGLPDDELRGICDSACAYKMAPYLPPRMRAILQAVGADRKTARGNAGGDEPLAPVDYEGYWQRLSPLLDGALADATEPLPDNIKIGGVLAAGAMFGTYLTRTWWQHYDGQERRLSFLVYVVGGAASGKSFTVDMDKLIMEPMQAADRAGREWERQYKEDKQKRATSTAAQKKAAEEIKHPVIRYVPSTISNAMLYQRLADAKEIVNGEEVHLHLYTCEAELATALRSQVGSWAGKLDIECKSFQNEFIGVDYKNEGSVNGIYQCNWNQVISGTPDAMNRKIKPTTVLDGLVTRLAIFVMPDSNFTMIEKRRRLRNHEAETRLRSWGHKLDHICGEVKCEKLVDAAYNWCEARAREAALENDIVADYFRKRVPMYMVRYGIVYNILRDFEYVNKQDATKPIRLRISTKDLKFAELIGDFIFDMQIRQYGEKVRLALENEQRDFVPRQRSTRNAEAYNKLPEKFDLKQAEQAFVSSKAARCFLTRALKDGYVQRLKQGKYRKLKNM